MGVKLAAYVRVSTASQQEAYGPDIQRKAIADWAKSQGHTIVAWHVDVISGASELRDRAGWREAASLGQVRPGTGHRRGTS
jgi:DNA invertase Pin-like site-specific DNA recombinase